jgi:hypothetical protein
VSLPNDQSGAGAAALTIPEASYDKVRADSVADNTPVIAHGDIKVESTSELD